MTAPTSLERVAALDLDRRFLEALLRRAHAEAHPRVVGRLLRLLAENAHNWGEAIGSRPVQP